MASVIVFPNVATHRKLPHLQPKDTHKDKTPATTAPTAAGEPGQSSQDAFHSSMHNLSIQEGKQPLQLTQAQQRPLIQDAASSTATPTQQQQQHQQLPRLIEPALKQALTVDTQPAQPHKDPAPLLSATSSSASSTSTQKGLPPSITDSPHSALPPLGLPKHAQPHHHPSAELLKTAIYDAFGCLYHPMQHTHQHSKSSSLSAAAALRSGEATPLVGLSPRASPRLLPQGTSGPITPLELSDENAASAHAGGYFGITPPTASSTSTVALTTTSSQGSAGKQGGAGSAGGGGGGGGGGVSSGGHHEGNHYHQHKPHTSSHLHTASSFSLDDDDGHISMHGRRSRPISAVSSRRSSITTTTMMTKNDTSMSAVEHPVLNTLQSMPHHHALPGYLDHDLGHDRIPLPPLPAPESTSVPAPASASAPMSATSVLSAASNSPPPSTNSSSHARTPISAQTADMSGPTPTATNTTGRRPSLANQDQQPPIFAMDREGPIPQNFGNHKLV
ncbi:hypothetical protein BGW42_004820 [Actinomortierella wolfii]|nr:hypothetical protein BGW42_004820 [Actinomortierella wolfii]KAG0227064.1 hypothetical protein BGW41_003986 [Actinomortierella wolfii]